MNTPTWRACLRIARREAWHNKARSLLIIALIGFPVLILAIGDIAYRTWQLSPTEKLTRTLGSADAIVAWGQGGEVRQDPRSLYKFSSEGTTAGIVTDPPKPPTSVPAAALPAGTRAVEWQKLYGVTILTAIGRKYVDFNGLDYADPMTRGLAKPVSGRAPRTTGEIAFTRTLARDTGLRVGDAVHTAHPDRTYRLVGVVADASRRNAIAAYTLPSGLPELGKGSADYRGTDTSWLVDAPGAVTWSDVLELNRDGFVALSRHVYVNPPPASQVRYHPGGHRLVNPKVAATGTLIGGMALLEIVLLAGPAFAVSARRQRRDLALIAAVGGRRQDLRNVVLAKGIVLGVAGGLLSIGLAVALAAIGVATVGPHVNQIPGHLDLRPELPALALIGVLTALAAAVFPARGAARTDVMAALAGRRGTVRTRKRVPLFGVIVAGIGVLVAVGALGASADATVILAGVALTEIGLIICLPALLGLVSRIGRWLPLPPRIALRDAGRNRSSAAPAIAAVMAAVIGCVALLIGVASTNDQDRRNYHPMLPMNDGVVHLGVSADTTIASSQVIAALQPTLPGAQLATATIPSRNCPATDLKCSTVQADLLTSTGDPVSWHPGSSTLPMQVVDDGSDAETLLQTRSPAALAALGAGRVVVTAPDLVSNGQVRLQVTTYPPSGEQKVKTTKVPATLITADAATVRVIMPPSLVARLGVPTSPDSVYVDTMHRPTERERQAVADALAAVDPDLRLEVETGFHDSKLVAMLAFVIGSAVIAIGATMIATALSNVDARADLTTLGAVGAAPRTRRLLATSRAGVIAGIGTGLGALAGFVPSFAWIHSHARLPHDGSAGLHFVVPWLPFVLTIVAVPVAAMIIAGLTSRSRLPSERPAE